MKSVQTLILSLCLFAGSVFGSVFADAQSARRPVVVELFTSEGCSSCPPADLLLQKLQAQQPFAGAEIIPLEEHVDYWNRDGWVDPYSSSAWTERQQEYASLMRNDPYTPEAVVDGQLQFVGNNKGDAKVDIEKAALATKTDVAIDAGKLAVKGSMPIHVSVGKIDESGSGDVAEVWLAVTEDGLRSSVSHGENAGRVLQHIGTLRLLQKVGVASTSGASAFSGDSLVKFDSRWKAGNLHVTVFVQNRKGREILGAASMKIGG